MGEGGRYVVFIYLNVAASAQVLPHQACGLMFAMNLISDYLLINAQSLDIFSDACSKCWVLQL